MSSTGILRARLGLTLALISLAGPALAQGNYTLFESGPVRPLALSANGLKLFACNIPDGRLEIFDVSAAGLVHSGSVPVGVDPVAVAVSPTGDVWVVNHLSDSVSIVNVASQRVVRTLLVGDEPRDIVFAGVGRNRAFITAAHRGQNRPATQSNPNSLSAPDPNDPSELFTPGIGRADIWVFNATNLSTLGTSLGGDEIAILTAFGDTPRALAVSPDGLTVYAAVFHSGNQTTAVTEGTPDVPTPEPLPTVGGLPAPQVGVMLKYDEASSTPASQIWRDVDGDPKTNVVRFRLPDHDVFVIDADAATLNHTAITDEIDHVGTVLFNMVVHPTNGTIYVSNTEANNMDRFEGSGATTLRGELHRAQITVISGGVAQQRRLNPHIVYENLNPDSTVRDRSLAIPTDMAISSNGSTLYVAAFGSQKIGIVDTATLAAGTFTPSVANHVPLSAGGPGGVVLDETNGRLYVLTRFDNAISIVNTTTKSEIAHLLLHSPELPDIKNGRRFLYDSFFSSANGEASCASCHIFGDFDSLAWDLGDPAGSRAQNNNPFVKFTGSNFGITGVNIAAVVPATVPGNLDFHPLKGPMTSQTLRGMDHGGAMHWRGDRSGGTGQNAPFYDGCPAPAGCTGGVLPGADNEVTNFRAFKPAFEGLLGRNSPISDGEMLEFAFFVLRVQLPPNPIRKLDRTLTDNQAAGLTFFGTSSTVPVTQGPISDTLKDCNGCHTHDPSKGFFGTGGLSTFEGETQHFKVAHLRNAYQKVGMFGQVGLGADPNAPQVRGFGYLHDGSVDTVMTFLGSGNPASVFQFPGGDPQRKQVADLVLAFDTDVAPMVGQQVTLTADPTQQANVTPRLAELINSASTVYDDVDVLLPSINHECDLVVKGRIAGKPRGWWMSSPSVFKPDDVADASTATISDASLRLLANTAGQELTYTCVPPGSGPRLGINRGGVGDASQPDTIRDALQCGDVTEDGVATGADVARMRLWLASPGTPLAKCNVNAEAECNVADVSMLRHALEGPSPALSPDYCVL